MSKFLHEADADRALTIPQCFLRNSQAKHTVATVREKCLENEIFSRSGNFVDGQGNLEI